MKSILTTLLFICIFQAWHAVAQPGKAYKPKVVFRSEKLVVTQVAPHCYQHTSYKQTNDFGHVPCNGLVVCNKGEAIVFDTPTNDSASEILIGWISQTLHARINAVVPTHFHDDCLGGLKAFHRNAIPSYAHKKTITLAAANQYETPQRGFSDSLVLSIAGQQVMTKYFGEGHTIDNVVGYYAADKALFGGCLIKELNASKGYLGDANVQEWSSTVAKIKEAYPQVQLVVPGHGTAGGQGLLDYTIGLFQKK